MGQVNILSLNKMLLLFVLPVAFGAILPIKDQYRQHGHGGHQDLHYHEQPAPLGDSTGNDEYTPIEPEHYTPREIYKAGDMNDCHWVEKLVYKDECVPYTEKTCYTQQREHCSNIYQKNCTAVIDEFEEHECFDVTELICQLAESIDYEMVEETFTVQRCTRVNDRVCDTVYDLDTTTKDDFPYPVEKQNCHSEPMKKCELETRSRPKKAKKYNYVKECKPVKRQVCDDWEKKKLRPVCDKVQKNVCSYK